MLTKEAAKKVGKLKAKARKDAKKAKAKASAPKVDAAVKPSADQALKAKVDAAVKPKLGKATKLSLIGAGMAGAGALIHKIRASKQNENSVQPTICSDIYT